MFNEYNQICQRKATQNNQILVGNSRQLHIIKTPGRDNQKKKLKIIKIVVQIIQSLGN